MFQHFIKHFGQMKQTLLLDALLHTHTSAVTTDSSHWSANCFSLSEQFVVATALNT
jgi:hypothetical protein